eukprot:214005-Pyramimonas_sp.AAC.1
MATPDGAAGAAATIAYWAGGATRAMPQITVAQCNAKDKPEGATPERKAKAKAKRKASGSDDLPE